MSGVTWGNNTVHTIGGAPAPSTFGAPVSAFGAPAPATTGGFGFGAAAPSPANPAGGGFFGTQAATGGFGSVSQPQQPQVPQHHIPAQAAMQASGIGYD